MIFLFIDRPGPPEGPLNVDTVTRDSAEISWQAPKDDGDCPITHYVVEKMDTTRGTWMEAGQTPNFSYKVPKLIHKKSYQFRVAAVNEMGQSEYLETTRPIIAKDRFEPPSQPGRPDVTDYDKDHVDLEWIAPKDDGGSPVQKYIIQKRERGNPFWSKGAEVAGNQLKCTVPDLREGQDYEFRIIAVNQGGESEPSDSSQMITCRPRKRKYSVIVSLEMIEQSYKTCTRNVENSL